MGFAVDTLALAVAFFVSAAACLTWLYRSARSEGRRTWRAAVAILVRLGLVIVPSYLVLCVLSGLPAVVFAGLELGVVLLVSAATGKGIPANDALGFGIVNSLSLSLFLLKQFVLGFPDLDLIVLAPPELSAAGDDLSQHVHSTGVVIAPLKPCGVIQIDANRYAAKTLDGKYLDVGTSVRVIDGRNNPLVVIPETPSA